MGGMDIEVKQLAEDPWEFDVRLLEGDTQLGDYRVMMSMEEYERYSDNVEPHELVEGTFRFLLDHEQPDMILEHFRLRDVEKYYPEYPDEVVDYC